jgi:hypothetical protein
METRISQISQHFLFVKIECHFYYLFLKKEKCVFIAEKFTRRSLFVHSSGFPVTLNLDKITLYEAKAFVVVDVCCTTFYILNWGSTKAVR